MKTLAELQTEVGEWTERNFSDRDVVDPALGMVEELGEFCHAVLKLRQGIRGVDDAAAFRMEADALGDLLIYVLDYCNLRGIELQTALEDVWSEVSKRDWRKYPLDGLTR